MRDEKTKEINDLKEIISDRKKQIVFYERFMDVERHQIKEQIEDLRRLIQVEKDQKEVAIA